MLRVLLCQTCAKSKVSVCCYNLEDITCQILWRELYGLVPLGVVQLLPHSAKTTNDLNIRFIYHIMIARLVLTIFGINEQQGPYFSFMVFHIRTTPWHAFADRPCSWQSPVMVRISSWYNLKYNYLS